MSFPDATIYSLFGAAPGLVIVARTWVKGLKLASRMSTIAFAERKWNDADLTNKQKLDLWSSPDRFIGPDDSAAMVDAKRAILAYRYKGLLGLWGGGILAFAGGIIGSLIARGLA
ncbi:hypothetical protein [Xanthomonas bonasiae]|uniref:hypothetical protein n=1 Tax=Xanthomonas bonasiae TaxID=2810351 RepID=UPI0017828C29|nr:hypothetical protein [Xanthomonas surreyensis]MBD7923749.1 hypothetical protein [Xanthomonas surreyensis]